MVDRRFARESRLGVILPRIMHQRSAQDMIFMLEIELYLVPNAEDRGGMQVKIPNVVPSTNEYEIYNKLVEWETIG